MNEKKLIDAIQNRDESAAAYVIDRYSRLLWSAEAPVLRNIGTAEDLEECVADAFVYLWEHPEKFDLTRGSLKSWLAMIVRSRAIDRYRQLVKRQTVSIEDALLQTEMIPEAPGLEEETRDALMQALGQLTEPDREILMRRYYFDQKPKEIAKATGLTVKQVENHLYRTKRRLRETLTEVQDEI